MKFRLLSVVAPAQDGSGFDAHIYGSIDNGAAASAEHHSSALNDDLDARREAVFAAVAGGKMVRYACPSFSRVFSPRFFQLPVQVCTEHVEIDKSEIAQHLLMAAQSSSPSSAIAVRGDAAAKCLLALALCHSTVRDPATSSATPAADVPSRQPGRSSFMACCPSSSAADDRDAPAADDAGVVFP
jgi:hypothetical protein